MSSLIAFLKDIVRLQRMVVALIALTLFSCSFDDREVAALKDTANTSDIWVSAASLSTDQTTSGAATGQKYDLVVSTPATDDTIVLCEATDAKQCNATMPQYRVATKARVDKARSFYIVKGFALRDAQTLAFRAFASSNALTSNRERVVQVGTGSGPGTTPGTTSGTVRPSNGTGGQKDLTSGPLPSHTFQGVTSVYRVHAPASNGPTTPQGLLVYLHGDTGSNFGDSRLDPQGRAEQGLSNYHQPRPTLDQARFEAQQSPTSLWNSMVFVAILTPSHNGYFLTWNTRLGAPEKLRNADFVNNLLETKVLSQYNIDLNQVYFVGQSGGANFVSNTLMPKHGAKFRGGSIMLCGGEPPVQGVTFNPTADWMQGYKLHYQITNNEMEDLKTSSQQSATAYRTQWGALAQSHVTYEVTGQGEHCEFRTTTEQPVTQPALLEQIIRRMRGG